MKKEQLFGFKRTLCTMVLSLFIVLPQAGGQTSISGDEIPLERCDRLPVVKAHTGEMELRLLVDTGATTMLNLKSFAGGSAKHIRVSSWSGTADTSAREVSLSTLTLGSHTLRNLKLPAIDLSPI